MIDTSLEAALRILATDIARPLDVNDTASPAELKQSFLQQRVLATYRDQLAGLDEAEHYPWLIERLAGLETRIMALQMALLGVAGRDGPGAGPERTDGVAPLLPEEKEEESGLPEHVIVVCDQTLAQKGLYYVERGIDGRPFRWIGPGTRLAVALPRVKAPFDVRISIYSVYVEAALERARFSIDGGEWQRARREGEGENLVLSASSSAIGADTGADTVEVELEVEVNDSPSNHDQDDARRLSLAVSRIELVHVKT